MTLTREEIELADYFDRLALADRPTEIIKKRERQRRYLQTDKGKAALRKYEQSEKAKERQKKYFQSEKGKEMQRMYEQRKRLKKKGEKGNGPI